MRLRNLIPAALLIFLPVLFGQCHALTTKPQTTLRLADGSTGRVIAVEPLREGQEVVYTWKNSMFRLMVTETLVVRNGRLVLTEVTYADPRGREPFLAGPEDLDDLFQTGGPFRVTGISRPFSRLIFRVGEIGRPKLKIGQRVVDFTAEVGFGGSVVLTIVEGVQGSAFSVQERLSAMRILPVLRSLPSAVACYGGQGSYATEGGNSEH